MCVLVFLDAEKSVYFKSDQITSTLHIMWQFTHHLTDIEKPFLYNR